MTDGDETGDYTPFWAERDYNPDVGQGQGERLRRPRDQRQQRQARPLQQVVGRPGRRTTCRASSGSPRPGHIDPFDFRRAEWVSTLHRWFDYWLQGVETRIMNEPEVDYRALRRDLADRGRLARPALVRRRAIWLQPSETPGTFGTVTKQRPARKQAPADVHRQPEPEPEHDDQHHDAAGANRLLFLSPPLLTDLRFSGTPGRARRVRRPDGHEPRRASSSTTAPTSGCSTRTATASRTLPPREAPETCWGEPNPAVPGEDACYLQTVERRDHGVAGGRHEGHPRRRRTATRTRPRSRSWSASRTRSPSRCCPRTTSSRPGTDRDRGRRQLLGLREHRRSDQGEHHAERA